MSKGIRANYVTVGWVVTPGELDVAQELGRDAQWQEQGVHRIPSCRMQTEEDMAYGVVYLLSDESSQLFASDLHITGGFVPSRGF